MHGENDAVVPLNYLLEAKDFLLRNKIDIEAHIIKNCDHRISRESSSLALNYIKKNLNF
jgi:phospholipase/carboxylesterase